MTLTIELDREEDGRWIAEAVEIPGVMAYGATREEAIGNTERLAIEVITDRVAHGEMPPSAFNVSFSVSDDQMAKHLRQSESWLRCCESAGQSRDRQCRIGYSADMAGPTTSSPSTKTPRSDPV
ncbi:MAG: type II toxin-antitoxin system HicB family antitoxin [Acidobacteriota bacterium]